MFSNNQKIIKECLENYEDISTLLFTAEAVGYNHQNFPWVPCLDNYLDNPYLPEKPNDLIR